MRTLTTQGPIHRKNRVAARGPGCMIPRVNDYERMARIIRHLDEHFHDQPSLNQLAELAGMSAFHFHRSFVAWTGVTPKDFLQCLTLTHAKAQLKRGASVLSSALESGLSGPSRLHDLCVTLEAASPGDIKSGGLGLVMQYGFAPSLFGECMVGQSERGICHLQFLSHDERPGAEAALARAWPHAQWKREDRMARAVVRSIFRSDAHSQTNTNLRAWIKGTPFQIRVWRALLQIPPGQFVSYGQLATHLDHPHAARAVGTAIGANPLALLIPCHRVIQSTGVVGGYRWGTGRKRTLLAWEGAREINTKHQDPKTK